MCCDIFIFGRIGTVFVSEDIYVVGQLCVFFFLEVGDWGKGVSDSSFWGYYYGGGTKERKLCGGQNLCGTNKKPKSPKPTNPTNPTKTKQRTSRFFVVRFFVGCVLVETNAQVQEWKRGNVGNSLGTFRESQEKLLGNGRTFGERWEGDQQTMLMYHKIKFLLRFVTSLFLNTPIHLRVISTSKSSNTTLRPHQNR
ncbi:hypothetical protein BC832DRAFT_300801 [Gaertneriomyces semiglobifer]|nr:hypothetical protein BC832DRAFT_300801 [Gaertneriomyces semiglobifer]